MASGDDSTARMVELGLTLSEARCYLALLKVAPRGVVAGELAQLAGVPRPKVYATLKSLEQRSFCRSSGSGGVITFRAVEPDLALGEWTRKRQHDRRLADEQDVRTRDTLLATLPRVEEPEAPQLESIMELTGGPVATAEVLNAMMFRAQRRIDVINSEPVLQDPSEWNVSEIAALERGVQVRMLFVDEQLAKKHRFAELVRAGAEVRLASGAAPKLLVRDEGEEALVGLPSPGDQDHPTCVVVRPPEVVAPLQLMFNREWRRGQPITP